jgi:hypothetical protein
MGRGEGRGKLMNDDQRLMIGERGGEGEIDE